MSSISVTADVSQDEILPLKADEIDATDLEPDTQLHVGEGKP
jgi:hypothetical protein